MNYNINITTVGSINELNELLSGNKTFVGKILKNSNVAIVNLMFLVEL